MEYMTLCKILHYDFYIFHILLALILYTFFPFFLLVSLKSMLSITSKTTDGEIINFLQSPLHSQHPEVTGTGCVFTSFSMLIQTYTTENSLVVPQKIKLEFPYNSAIPLPGIYLKELKTGPQIRITHRFFTAVLFVIAKK